MILELLHRKKSVVRFEEKAVEREKIGKILESARWVNSPDKLQAIEFVVIDDPELIEMLMKELNIVKSPVYISIICNKKLLSDKYGEMGEKIGDIEVGEIISNMILIAIEENLGLKWFLMDDRKIKEILEIPEEYDASNLILIGYSQEENEFIPSRFKITDTVYLNKFGKKYMAFYDEFEWKGLKYYMDEIKKRVLKGKGIK